MTIPLIIAGRIGPTHPAVVAKMIGEYIELDSQSEGVVRAPGVVPVRPIEEAIVEDLDVSEQQFFVKVDELVQNGAVEAFAVGIHAGRAWIASAKTTN